MYMDNPKEIISNNNQRKIKALGRLKGSTDKELQDLTLYNH